MGLSSVGPEIRERLHIYKLRINSVNTIKLNRTPIHQHPCMPFLFTVKIRMVNFRRTLLRSHARTAHHISEYRQKIKDHQMP